jgi:APA family basic amino acid/polyamine antiporter
MSGTEPPQRPNRSARLRRDLGTFDAVVLGLGSMLGAGVFVAYAPAAAAAGPGLLLGLVVAGVVAYANATASARLAARHPEAGGTYVYGRRRLGDFWGYLAGWGFVVGKTASCAAMALTVAHYVAPAFLRPVAAGVVVALTALTYAGIRKSAWLTRVIVAVTLGVLTFVVVVCLTLRPADSGDAAAGTEHVPLTLGQAGTYGILQAAGLLFFAFAGYARIATLGEEVRDPARTIPRAITLALGIVVAVYAAVGVALLVALGPARLATVAAPLDAAVRLIGLEAAAPVVRVGAAVAALGSLLALLLGVSRTVLAMARDGHLPRVLDTVHPRTGVPHHAEIAVGACVLVVAVSVDLRGAIGFSSFGVLTYYAIANASAWRLRPDENPPPRWLPGVGLVGCVVLAATLPVRSVAWGAAVLGVGILVWAARRLARRPKPGKRPSREKGRARRLLSRRRGRGRPHG